MMARVLLIAAAALGGVLVGRRAIGDEVRKRLPAEIEAAKASAACELDRGIGDFIRERLLDFLASLLAKAVLVAGFYLLYVYGEMTAHGLKIIVSSMIAGFIVRDVLKSLPYVGPALVHVRRHGWNPRRAVQELVAGVAFERAYARALSAARSGPNRHWIALSNYSAHALSVDVADAVADLARTTTLQRARARALIALATALLTFSAYLALLLFALRAG